MKLAFRLFILGAALGAPRALRAQAAAADTARVPATGSTVTTELKQSESNDDQIVYVDNRSSQNIVVTSLKFSECENLKVGCHIVSLKVRIKAGDKQMVYRIVPRNPDQPISFRYSFTWEPELGP
jgi:hypothetical protein